MPATGRSQRTPLKPDKKGTIPIPYPTGHIYHTLCLLFIICSNTHTSTRVQAIGRLVWPLPSAGPHTTISFKNPSTKYILLTFFDDICTHISRCLSLLVRAASPATLPRLCALLFHCCYIIVALLLHCFHIVFTLLLHVWFIHRVVLAMVMYAAGKMTGGASSAVNSWDTCEVMLSWHSVILCQTTLQLHLKILIEIKSNYMIILERT